MSGVYDLLTAAFERRHAERALGYLSIREGESVLEIGFGSGHCLRRIATSVGRAGKVCGLDLSPGMLRVAKRRLAKAKALDRVTLCCGDAATLPFREGSFDAVFVAFTLELFDSPQIPEVLHEVRRVLRPKGRFGVVGMSKEDGDSMMVRLYEWVHRRWPEYADCRPIYVERSLIDAGYRVQSKSMATMAGMPLETVVAEAWAEVASQ
ncbi:MAG: 2-heptaprenyl-1,4-naphthoquinone methyltransferase [Chloroflexi bacterium RBG_13_60_13]|nr:MAG: 2-heptaprenyl-1,4-naphthoquinone methyltransferase [Chloroflexi bacterium RBG_13_60_13]